MTKSRVAETSLREGSREALQEAVRLCGSPVALAEAMGVSPQFVSQLLKGRRPVPPGRCARIEAATGGEVRKERLRPDVFGPASDAA